MKKGIKRISNLTLNKPITSFYQPKGASSILQIVDSFKSLP
jgi:hypothetical protein